MSLKGQLLIAGPGLLDPNFRRTVVLVGEHNEEGALGVVLNRPASLSVWDAAAPLAPLVQYGEPVFLGGPVQPEGAVVLAEFEHPETAGLLVFGAVGFVMGEVPEDVAVALRRARVFAGYAGWGPGQLEQELAESSWIPEPALAEDVFAPQPERLWSSVLRRKGGDFAILATMPVDPSSN